LGIEGKSVPQEAIDSPSSVGGPSTSMTLYKKFIVLVLKNNGLPKYISAFITEVITITTEGEEKRREEKMSV